MSKDDQLIQLIEKGGDLIPFLKGLKKDERKKLLPTLEKLSKKHFQYKQRSFSNEYGYTTEEIHRTRINTAGLVCADTITQFRENIGWHAEQTVLSDKAIKEILPWHIPKWFNRSLNRMVQNWGMLDYKKMIYLIDQGYLKARDELIANQFVNTSCVHIDFEKNRHKREFTYDTIINEPVALNEHFWLIFEQETSIHSKWKNPKENDWIEIIPHLIEQGLVDRDEVISKSILTCTKGFNNSLGRWYFQLIKKLKPTTKELIKNQDNIYTCLNSDSGNAIKFGLNSVKAILNEKDFDEREFLNVANYLLNSPTKTTVNTTLMILEKLLKKNKDIQEEATAMMIDSLVISDEKIQTRIAKNIVKYLPVSEEYITTISTFSSELLNTPKTLLNAYISVDESEYEIEELDPIEVLDVLSEENRLELPKTFDDLVFRISKIYDDRNHVDATILTSLIHRIDKLITKENADKLSPAFNRSIDFKWNTWFTGIPNIQASYINDYALTLDSRFPGALKNRNRYLVKIKKDNRDRQDFHIKSLHKAKAELAYKIPKRLYINNSELLKKKLDLISTPTHNPCWIDPAELVNRILEYQEQNAEIGILDWQVAINRLPIKYHTSEDFIAKLSSIKFDVYRSVLKIKSLVRNDVTTLADYSWKHDQKEYFTHEWDHKTRKSKKVTKYRQCLIIDKFSNEEIAQNTAQTPKNPKTILNSIKKLFGATVKKNGINISMNSINFTLPLSLFHSLYKFKGANTNLYVSYTYYSMCLNSEDTKLFLSMVPNQYHLILVQLIDGYLEDSNLPDENSKRVVTETAEFLIDTWHRKDEHEITYLFIATLFLCDQKVTRETIAEWWTTYSEQGLIDQSRLGSIIGKLLSKKYAPLKRFTDIIQDYMYNLGKVHDENLYLLISHMIPSMSNKPITNAKKLLSFYSELKLKYNLTNSVDVNEKIEFWKTSKSLIPVIKKISQQNIKK